MVYRISEAGVFQKLHELTRAEGYAHTGELIQARDGSFYGTARAGGAYSSPAGNFEGGTIFKFTPGADEASSVYTTLYSFAENDPAGGEPYAGLVQGSDDLLYGTTIRGGANGIGALFNVTTTGSVTALAPFDPLTARQSMGELIEGSPGQLLGTTAFGGSAGEAGVVFRFTFGNATTTSLNASPTASLFGQPVTLAASVAASSGTPSGEVKFFDDTTSLGNANLASGQAAFATTALGVGAHSITATYGGDGTFLESTSSAISVTVSRAATTTTLTSSANPSRSKQSVTFTATVSAVSPGAGTAKGQVQFLDGKKKLGTGTLVNGVATLQLAFNGMGSHDLKATYAGDLNFTGSTSATLTQNVNK